MPPDLRRLARLQRLEKVRALTKQEAAAEAARAEGTLAQLEALAARTGRLATHYAGRSQASDGYALNQLTTFIAGLHGINTATSADAVRAKDLADARQRDLARAERSRAAVETRANETARAISGRGEGPVLEARRGFGTGLE